MIEDLKPKVTSKFITQLEEAGIKAGKIHRNLPVKMLVELAVQKNEGILTSNGSLSVKTGKYTGRSPDDRYIIDDDETHNNVDWGKVNHPFSEEKFEKIFQKMKKHIEGKEIYV
ncbi:MAG: phosphoenolpyruvate carboxykinase (ATP), partial [Nitrososphaerota archaeon]